MPSLSGPKSCCLPDLGDVHVKGELVAKQSEHLVLGGTVHEVETGADVGGCFSLVLETQHRSSQHVDGLQYSPLVMKLMVNALPLVDAP
jgi:hypothetical protein